MWTSLLDFMPQASSEHNHRCWLLSPTHLLRSKFIQPSQARHYWKYWASVRVDGDGGGGDETVVKLIPAVAILEVLESKQKLVRRNSTPYPTPHPNQILLILIHGQVQIDISPSLGHSKLWGQGSTYPSTAYLYARTINLVELWPLEILLSSCSWKSWQQFTWVCRVVWWQKPSSRVFPIIKDGKDTLIKRRLLVSLVRILPRPVYVQCLISRTCQLPTQIFWDVHPMFPFTNGFGNYVFVLGVFVNSWHWRFCNWSFFSAEIFLITSG